MDTIYSQHIDDLVSVQPIENRVGMVNYIKYVYNTTKGKTTAGTEFASSLAMGKSDENYTTRRIDLESPSVERATSNTVISGNLAWTPVVPGTVNMTFGSVVLTDDGQGNLVATTGLAASTQATIDYNTGAFEFTLATGDASSLPTVTYEYNNEYIPAKDIPEIGLQIVSVPIQATARRLKAIYAFEASFELQKEYGEDMQSLLNTQAAAEIAHKHFVA